MRTLVAIGGGIDWRDPQILFQLIDRAGGRNARIVIMPQASREKARGEYYKDEFRKLGVKNPITLEFRLRSEAGQPKHLGAIRQADGIFFGGGTQMRIAALIGGTALEDEIMAAYERGAIICGTSAGTAIMSAVMLAYGTGGSPRAGMAQFSPGLGFTKRIIFDQHFRQRDRFGRLAYAVSMHPGLLGVGVDENTAAIVKNDSIITVAGAGAVTIVDGRELIDADTPEITSPSQPVSISGLKVHILTQGCSFDLKTRSARLVKKLAPDD